MYMNLKSFFQIPYLSSLTEAPLFPLEDGQSWHSPLKDGRPYFCQ